MPSIDPNTIYHHQTLDLTIKPMSQGRAIEDEVEKLLKEGFIQEIKYPTWQTNIITIKKKLGKWRMGVNFTDSSKEYPKEPYLLLHID